MISKGLLQLYFIYKYHYYVYTANSKDIYIYIMHVATIRLNTPKTVGPPFVTTCGPGENTRGPEPKKGALKLDRLSVRRFKVG